MVDPNNREFAKPFNRQESEYLKRTDFEVRMRFLEGSYGNMLEALKLFNEQKQSLRDFGGKPNVQVYQFVQDSQPTSQDSANGLITMPTVAYRLVDRIAQEEDVEFDEELEVHYPLDTTKRFALDDPATYGAIQKDQAYIKHVVNEGGKKNIQYYFVWPGGFGHYEPVSTEQDEHLVEFEFFKENSNELSLNDLTADKVLVLHRKLVTLNLWHFSKTHLDLSNPQSA